MKGDGRVIRARRAASDGTRGLTAMALAPGSPCAQRERRKGGTLRRSQSVLLD